MKQYKFENGFSICLIPVSDAKVVSMKLIVRTGIAYETSKTLGYSHMLEHILLDSNPKYPGVKGIEALESCGIDMNASTSNTMVEYNFLGSSKYWKLIFEFVSLPLIDPNFTQKVFDRERNAVIEELKNHLDNKLRTYKDTMWRTLHKNKPLAAPIKDIVTNTKKCKLSDIKKFFYEQYSPENITLLVVGKFPYECLMKEMKVFQYFSESKYFNHHGDCPNIITTDPGKTIFTKSPKVSKVYCDIVFKLDTAPYSKDFYIGKIMEYVLTHGFLSLLYKKLRIDKKWIYHMKSDMDVSCYASDFTITFNTDPKNFTGCIREIFKSLASLTNNIPSDILHMVREKIQTDYDKIATNNQISQLNRHYETLIIHEIKLFDIKKYYTNLLSIDQNDIMEFAEQYFSKSNAWIFYGASSKQRI